MPEHHGRSRSALIAEIEALRREVAELRQSQSGEHVTALRKAMRQAEAAAQAKTRFLANMSHELRTPMTAILGCAELLVEQGQLEDAPPEHLELLHALKRNGLHLTRIVSEILDLAKIEAGKLTIERAPTSLGELFQDFESMMGTPARQKGLAFELSLASRLPRSLNSDPTRLRQILMNLVANAIKFTEEGGIRLRVDLKRGDEDAELRFSVSDTGCGMSPATLEEVFEPFSQADTSSTRRAGGTGLGLPISRELARLLGGEIHAESIEGRGSTFSLVLPIEKVAEEELADPDELLAPEATTEDEGESTLQLIERVRREGPTVRILLVEDGPDNRKLFGLTLRKAGFLLTEAENGAEGVDAVLEREATAQAFDLILMDMQMPTMDGYEATRRLRAAGIDTPIVALTAHAMSEERERCLQVGCSDFATKPIPRRDLIELTLRNLGRAVGNDPTQAVVTRTPPPSRTEP